jgi:hypothetical protein
MSVKTTFCVLLGLVTGCTSAFAQAPSFNCVTDTHPDERAICSNAELSRLDNVANAGYEYVRRVFGSQYAKSITLPLLHARQACRSDIVCIKEQQLAAIQKFRSVGAPVGGISTPLTGSSASRPFTVSIETSVSGGVRPIVTGTTNLPDGMKLSIWLLKPWLPNARERAALRIFMCDQTLFDSGDCTPLSATKSLPDYVVVKNGQFTDGPFTDNGTALSPGTYVLEIWVDFVAVGQQPPDVLAILGPHGENMTGPLVGGCCFRSLLNQAAIQKQKDENLRNAPTLGASIYYARYVEIESSSYQSPAQPGQTLPDNIVRTYANCLLGEAKNGDYSSFDGGKSALRLMAQCLKEWEAYENACHQSGRLDFQCNAASAAMAQVTLKQLGK